MNNILTTIPKKEQSYTKCELVMNEQLLDFLEQENNSGQEIDFGEKNNEILRILFGGKQQDMNNKKIVVEFFPFHDLTDTYFGPEQKIMSPREIIRDEKPLKKFTYDSEFDKKEIGYEVLDKPKKIGYEVLDELKKKSQESWDEGTHGPMSCIIYSFDDNGNYEIRGGLTMDMGSYSTTIAAIVDSKIYEREKGTFKDDDMGPSL